MTTTESRCSRTTMVALLPKNRGLAAMADKALEGRRSGIAVRPYHARGEDIPLLANALAHSGTPFLAFTGCDLLEESLRAGYRMDPRIRVERIPWDDPTACFGKPALCALAAREANLSRERLRIAYCTRYARLSADYLQRIARSGIDVEPIPLSGAVESTLAYGIADVVVDIVVTGATMRRLDLRVVEILFLSDLALLEFP
jgi:ATP phosphoribosyltransferase